MGDTCLCQFNVCQTPGRILVSTDVHVPSIAECVFHGETAIALKLESEEVGYGSECEAEIKDVYGPKHSTEGRDRRVVYRWSHGRCKQFVSRAQASGDYPPGHVAGSVEQAALEVECSRLSAIVESQDLSGGNDVCSDSQNRDHHGRYTLHLGDKLGYRLGEVAGMPV